jgi:hypothetical protein
LQLLYAIFLSKSMNYMGFLALAAAFRLPEKPKGGVRAPLAIDFTFRGAAEIGFPSSE